MALFYERFRPDIFQRYIYNEGLGLLKLADTSLILINPSPSNVNKQLFVQLNSIYEVLA